jgi:hypothetical protein
MAEYTDPEKIKGMPKRQGETFEASDLTSGTKVKVTDPAVNIDFTFEKFLPDGRVLLSFEYNGQRKTRAENIENLLRP